MVNIIKISENFEYFLEMYTDLREIDKVFKLYDQLGKENLKATYKTLNNYLEMAMRVEDVTRIVDALKQFLSRSSQVLLFSLTPFI